MRRNPQEGKRKQKEKTSLTLTGLLMEGVEESSSGEGPTSERQRATLATNDFIQAQDDPCRIP
jgi:RNA-binding protein YlmH